MLANQLISLLSFRAFTSGSREDDLTINPASIQYIATSDRSTIAMDGGEYRATIIYFANTSIKVAQSREFIEFQVNRTREPEHEYIQDMSQTVAAK